MTFRDPRRADLRDTSALIPPTKTTTRCSVPWTAEEQRAIRWLKSAPAKDLDPNQKKLRGKSAPQILKTLSADELADLVTRWKSQL